MNEETVVTDNKNPLDSPPDFDDIYETYWPRVHRYVSQSMDQREAEDVTQEVFLKIAANLAGFRQDAKLSTWIYRIATNAVVDRFRQKKQGLADGGAAPASELDDFAADTTVRSVDKLSQPEGKVIRGEMNSCIRDVVDALPEKYRSVITLSEIEGFKNREIADILGVSLETVKIRLHRGANGTKNGPGRSVQFLLG